MKSSTIAALTALLSTGALAVPMAGHAHHHAGRHANLHHNKRDIVWITEFEVETVTVMKTVYGDGSEPTNSPDTLSAAETPSPVTFTSYAAQTSSAAPAPTTTTTTTTTPTVAPAAYTPSTTTTQAPAPTTTTTSTYVAPAPVPETTTTTTTTTAPTYQTPSKAATQPAPASSSAATSAPASYGGSWTLSSDATSTVAGSCHAGDFTHFDPALGACGITNSGTDSIVAISMLVFDQYTPNGNPNKNPLCGRTVTLRSKDGKSTYTATVTDRCVGCAEQDLDLTPTLFNTVTNNGDGRVPDMYWTWD
ncbi:hypothetical protein K461DRAFT_273306 [Myriangium duriaei CBS 260.36]|uniref:RlpA-like protein double-psi beta-barrel domain-containing protein n=1 Tax=Myriangium duriaei CBS 260.36 TaxID=1168546 RepID=A0A9P4MLC5_9PEZI|nr:hypothetical protein K461DRAFT_273306 [Myriangium duriaei CBS 260.36]